MSNIDDVIATALEEATEGYLSSPSVSETDNLLERGLTSHQIVQWMLAIEEALDIEFADSQLNRETFRSMESVRQAIQSLSD